MFLNVSKRKDGKFKQVSKFFILIGILFLSGCTLLGTSKEMNIGKESNGKVISTKVGNTVIITLEGNATTGYSWILNKYDEELIKFIDMDYITSDSHLMGAGGKWVAKFQIMKPGESKIHFVYKRPWETKVDPIENYEVTVNAAAGE